MLVLKYNNEKEQPVIENVKYDDPIEELLRTNIGEGISDIEKLWFYQPSTRPHLEATHPYLVMYRGISTSETRPTKTVNEAVLISKDKLFSIIKDKTINEATADTKVVTTDGYLMDGKRSDLDNIKNLVDECIDSSLTEVTIKDANNNPHIVTLEVLRNIHKDIRRSGLMKYNTKWYAEEAIMNATTIEEVLAVINSL